MSDSFALLRVEKHIKNFFYFFIISPWRALASIRVHLTMLAGMRYAMWRVYILRSRCIDDWWWKWKYWETFYVCELRECAREPQNCFHRTRLHISSHSLFQKKLVFHHHQHHIRNWVMKDSRSHSTFVKLSFIFCTWYRFSRMMSATQISHSDAFGFSSRLRDTAERWRWEFSLLSFPAKVYLCLVFALSLGFHLCAVFRRKIKSSEISINSTWSEKVGKRWRRKQASEMNAILS